MVRLRHRYLLTEYALEDSNSNVPVIRSASIIESLNSSIRRLHGIQGIALCKAGLLVKYINNSTSIVLIRMRRSAYDLVLSSLPFVRQADGKNITFKTMYTGATIKQCNKFLINYQRKTLEKEFGSLKSDLQKEIFKQALPKLKQYRIHI